MQKIINFLCVSLLILFSATSYAEQKTILNTPVGYWKTLDDVTGKPKAIIEIWQTTDRTLYGRVLKIFSRPGQDENQVCVACQGNKHNQRIVGMVILEKLKESKDNAGLWNDGKILDPNNGKVYKSNLQLSENGKKLNVRGYIGVPLFGRTQTWLRVDHPTA